MGVIVALLMLAIVFGCKAKALDVAQRRDDKRIAHIRKCKVCQTLGYEHGCTNGSVRI